MMQLKLGADQLTFAILEQCDRQALDVSFAPAAWDRLREGRTRLEHHVRNAEVLYGINTGFGHLKNTRIPREKLEKLQENLLISHAVGVGDPIPRDITRWMLLFKANMLLLGYSGVRDVVVRTIGDWLKHDLIPVVPSRGSLGASGDLAPLAHLFLPMLHRGEIWTDDSPAPAAPILTAAGVAPVALQAKEGLALINGTQLMSAYGAKIAIRARQLLDLADLIACMSLESARGTDRHAHAALHAARPHPGAVQSAANIRRHMNGSEILASHANCDRVQDPYSLRCTPQVHGAVRDAIEHLAGILEREINSVTDNPVIFEDEIISGGNFHGAPLAYALDYAAIALTDLGNISERRTYLLLHGDDVVPKLLLSETGLNSGFMIPQYTAAALVNECKVYASPASVDSIPSSLGQEDHVSMGATSAVKCFEILSRVEQILSIEMLCAAQGMDFHKPLLPGPGPAAARDLIRETIPFATEDREFGIDIREAIRLIRDGSKLLQIARNPSHHRGGT
ncbi:MAG: histidine ammonia-lyase [Phycisphaerae bacterium]